MPSSDREVRGTARQCLARLIAEAPGCPAGARILDRFLAFLKSRRELVAQMLSGTVDFDLRLGVTGDDTSDVRKILLKRVADEDRENVVVRGDLRYQPHRLGVRAGCVGDECKQSRHAAIVGSALEMAALSKTWIQWTRIVGAKCRILSHN